METQIVYTSVHDRRTSFLKYVAVYFNINYRLTTFVVYFEKTTLPGDGILKGSTLLRILCIEYKLQYMYIVVQTIFTYNFASFFFGTNSCSSSRTFR